MTTTHEALQLIEAIDDLATGKETAPQTNRKRLDLIAKLIAAFYKRS